MKTALDLPDDLVREVKIRAVMQGRRMKDVIAELLRIGLDAPADFSNATGPTIARDSISGLPVILCRQTPSKQDQLTPERLASILLDQEVEWHHEAGR